MNSERVFIRILGIPLGATVKFRNLDSTYRWTRRGRVVYIDRNKFGDPYYPYYTIQAGGNYYIRNESEVELIDQSG